MAEKEKIIGQTRNWIQKIVIGCGFCPFAAREMNRDSIRYLVISTDEIPEILESLIAECRFLDEHTAIETSLLIFPDSLKDFDKYLDLVSLSEDLLKARKYEGVYQLASFHPDYLFAGSDQQDAANFTNRSPYPMLHLLREESIETALSFYEGDPDEIPERNISFAREKGLTYMKMLRDACFK